MMQMLDYFWRRMGLLKLFGLLVLWAAGGLLYAAHAAAPDAMPDVMSNADGMRFTAITLHDAADTPYDMADDAISSDRLVAFFEWLRGNGFTAVSLNDIEAAQRAERPLPPRAVLLTVDDGYASLYSRVFPLALAYRFPIVAALAGSWMEGDAYGQVMYGDQRVPRSRFVSWAQAREMQASGLVEFASHGYDIHRTVRGNPQGNLMPAASTRLYAEPGGYEDTAAYSDRLRGDLQRARVQLQRELGRAPRAIAWPFGRYSQNAVDVARQVGFTWALTLNAGPSSALNPMAVSRHFPSSDPSLDTLASMVRNNISFNSAQRWVCLNPATLWTGDMTSTDDRLGRAIERYRTLGVTGVVIDAAQADADGGLKDVWFPSNVLPLRADLLSRLVWQLQTRAGLQVQVHLSARQALYSLGSPQRVLQLFDDLGTYVPMGGLWVDDALWSVGGERPPHGGQSWETRSARDALDATTLAVNDALTLQAFRAVQRGRPWLQLALASNDPGIKGLSPLADVRWSVTSLESASAPRDATHAAALAATAPAASARLYRNGVWLSSANPPQAEALAAAVLQHQRLGERVLGWCSDDPVSNKPDAFRAAPAVSGATFPVKF